MKTSLLRLPLAMLALTFVTLSARAEDGYRLWLRYDRIADDKLRQEYFSRLDRVTLETPTGLETPTIVAALNELRVGLAAMTGGRTPILVVRRRQDPVNAAGSSPDSYSVTNSTANGAYISGDTFITGESDIGVLYGVFAFLRHIQLGLPLPPEMGGMSRVLITASTPKIQRRLLDHWDNLNGFVERGYAGDSLWQWFYLPEIRSPRYRDYARALASLGLNGTVINNVNANALILTPTYLRKVAALAEEFRPYGIRLYLTARFSAPIEIGGLKTADPLDPAVAAWWKAKVDEIYTYIPDFGGFLVKANSEGQPGPQDYQRTHADGANMLADALAPHGGIVMWRAFVYAADVSVDRVKQAYNEFVPLDGKFRDNVVVQVKNGPLDFMPREPFSPLFGAMKHTVLAPELQITQEYTGQSTQLAYLAPMWKEVLDADTFANGTGSTVARVSDGSIYQHKLSMIVGVANTGTDRNWTGHPLAQANWYAFGRLAWDHTLTAEQLANEWIRLTYGSDAKVVATIKKLLLGSRETMVNYSMPLGLHHIMAEGHHYGPGPWVTGGRADWTAPYYHQADAIGLGANRTATGSNALEQYAAPLAKLWGDLATVPDNLLLWFHHVPWDYKMKSGRILWDELALRYQQGVDEVRAMQKEWDSLKGLIDDERFTEVKQRLVRQELDARDWRDACLLYFQTFSKRPLPAGVEKPAHDLDYYKSVKLRYAPGHPGAQ